MARPNKTGRFSRKKFKRRKDYVVMLKKFANRTVMQGLERVPSFWTQPRNLIRAGIFDGN